jgi:F-type H+-transporting ATPase subunit b
VEGLPLGINLSYLLAQLINFFLLLVLLYLVAYKPVLKMLDQRSNKVKESMEQVEVVNKRTAEIEEEAAKRVDEARQEGQGIIKQAMEAAEGARAKARQEAKEEARALITKAQEEIQHERDEAVEELRREVADLTIMAAGKVVGRSLDKEAHRKIIDKVLDEAPELRRN